MKKPTKTTVSRLRVGQRFSWIPREWFGAGKLISKTRRTEYSFVGFPYAQLKRTYVYDLKYSAAVVNPPAVDYGIPGSTRVKILKAKKKQ